MFEDPVLISIPVFLLCVGIEYLSLRKMFPHENYDLRDGAASIGMGVGSLVISYTFGFISLAASYYIYRHRLFNISFGFLQILALVVLEDFIYYWFHRGSHWFRFWWVSHVNHHSSKEFNLTTALRQDWTGIFVLDWAPWLPMAFIGFPPEWILFQNSLNITYQFWIHTRTIGMMPKWFESIFNSPRHHRVHHGINPGYVNHNFGGIFIIWDRLFGTFAEETPDKPIVFGLKKNIQSYNLFVIAFHEWAAMLKEIWSTPGLLRKLKTFIR